jgi:hypothetical protein
MFEIAEPDDPGFAVRRAMAVTGREALDAGGAETTARKLPQRGRSGRAEPYHDHVEMPHRPNQIVSKAILV